MRKKTVIDEFEAQAFGPCKKFVDSWRGMKAVCYLLGRGPGPEGELVRLVGIPKRTAGFDLYFVKSYVPRMGHAKAAYQFVVETYGPISAREVTSPEGLSLNLAMQKQGLVDSIEVEESAWECDALRGSFEP